MPVHFNRLGVSFQYPDNWTLDDSDAVLGRKSVTVYSPGGGFWTLALYSGSDSPDKLASALVDSMREEYQGLEAEPVEETVANQRLKGFDLAFYCLDLTNTARIRGFRFAHTTYIVFCQAEDREFEQIGRVFQAMTFSMLNHLTSAE